MDCRNFKSVRGCILIGMYANQLTVSQCDKSLMLHCVTPVIKIRNPQSHEFWYWKIDWIEDEAGDDLLIIEEQETPEPIEYRFDPEIAPHNHLLFASSFSVERNLIKKVRGYGFRVENREFLTSIVFELEKSFIFITTGAVISAKVTTEEPDVLGSLIFECS